jgi:two-component system, OmpR family, phosphate regulon sensor histidine kinase PhoR
VTERFFRVDPARSRQLGGTGLGLAIVKHILRRHRGHLAIASELGRGTTVTVYLPAEVSQAAPQLAKARA